MCDLVQGSLTPGPWLGTGLYPVENRPHKWQVSTQACKAQFAQVAATCTKPSPLPSIAAMAELKRLRTTGLVEYRSPTAELYSGCKKQIGK